MEPQFCRDLEIRGYTDVNIGDLSCGLPPAAKCGGGFAMGLFKDFTARSTAALANGRALQSTQPTTLRPFAIENSQSGRGPRANGYTNQPRNPKTNSLRRGIVRQSQFPRRRQNRIAGDTALDHPSPVRTSATQFFVQILLEIAKIQGF